MEESVDPVEIVTDQIEGLIATVISLAPNFLAAIVILLVTFAAAYIAGKASRNVLRRSRSRQSLIEAVSKIVKIVIWVIGLLIAATVIFPNLTPTKLLAGLGIGSLAIGLAFKDVFENFLAGFLILLRKPMRIGDDIECEGLSGRVEQITIRDTFLRKRSGELILVPNSYIFKNPVKILTDQALRRIAIVVGVAYGENVDESRTVIEKAMEGLDTIDTDKPVQVFATEFNSSSIDFMVRWWTKSEPIDEHRSRDQVVAAIKAALDEAGIEIPFPYRTMTFAEPLQIETIGADSQGTKDGGEPERRHSDD